MNVEGKRVLVVGLGKTGEAAVRFLHDRGATLSVVDERPVDLLGKPAEALRGLGIAVHGGGHPSELFAGQDLIVPSPGVPWNLPELVKARENGAVVAGELEIAAGYLRGRVVGVTGTNGKTTTTALIGHILEAAGKKVLTGGNIGRPVLSMIENSTAETWNVLELSSFQLEAMTHFRSHIGVVLNVTPDHLDRHGTFEAYSAAKERMVDAQAEDDVLVVNQDDAVCRRFAERAHGSVAWFSRISEIADGAWVRDGWIVYDGTRVAQTQLPIRGNHNLENALAAVAACRQAGAPLTKIADGLRSFRPVEHRLEFVRKIGGVAYYNDSKATNVDAAAKAIDAFDGGLWVILGGKDKGSDFSVLKEPMAAKARAGLLIGAGAKKIDRQLAGAVETQHVETLERAVARAKEQAQPGDTVLLAPACASFDQFANYEERGRRFKELVENL